MQRRYGIETGFQKQISRATDWLVSPPCLSLLFRQICQREKNQREKGRTKKRNRAGKRLEDLKAFGWDLLRLPLSLFSLCFSLLYSVFTFFLFVLFVPSFHSKLFVAVHRFRNRVYLFCFPTKAITISSPLSFFSSLLSGSLLSSTLYSTRSIPSNLSLLPLWININSATHQALNPPSFILRSPFDL